MSSEKKHILRVAIQRPFYKVLDYQCDFEPLPVAGCRVRVPLGTTSVIAIVLESGVDSSLELKKVTELIDAQPLFDGKMLSLLLWASRYYVYPVGEVLFHALPGALRKGRPLPRQSLWRAASDVSQTSLEPLKRAPKQYAMLLKLLETECNALQLQEYFGNNWKNILRQLEQKGLIAVREIDAIADIAKDYSPDTIPEKKPVELTTEQAQSVKHINHYFSDESPKPVLVHGITGSGKTEVYLRAMEPVLAEGKQILLLVPEIGLTPQLLLRVKEHFPQYRIASLHSALGDKDRMHVWLGAKSGKLDIIIGTRSAVFTPMKNLGAILIDEEHDASFKQQEGFLYQGRDMAIKRAHDEAVPILLGSATPSLESLHNAQTGRYHYLRLTSRPGKSVPPQIVLQDVRSLVLEAGVSQLMMDEIRQHLSAANQVMLFLNRRGFAPILMCPACGWHAECKQCDVGMTYHAASGRVICHHCGAEERDISNCPSCGNERLTTQGQGTERIEEVLKTHFPNVPVIRIDRDSTSTKGSLEVKLEQVRQGEPVILIGTQMLTKGHDFPNLTLVGILDVDQALFSMDYRAQERLAQQILQVAGRAGRGERKGRVVLQTSQPEHPLLLGLLSNGYYQTAKQILNERKQWNYPPFGAQALIRANAPNSDSAYQFLLKIADQIQLECSDECEMMGPMPSAMMKRAGRYRFQILFSARQRGSLHAMLDKVLQILIGTRKAGGVRWTIDVDPADFV